jgi:hypothetical protein
MPTWRQWLLGGYYYGSLPWRAWHNARARSAGRSPVIVLFYHRVADTQPNPWTTSNRTFARQIRWLKRHFDMVSLAVFAPDSMAGHRSQSRLTMATPTTASRLCRYWWPRGFPVRISSPPAT